MGKKSLKSFIDDLDSQFKAWDNIAKDTGSKLVNTQKTTEIPMPQAPKKTINESVSIPQKQSTQRVTTPRIRTPPLTDYPARRSAYPLRPPKSSMSNLRRIRGKSSEYYLMLGVLIAILIPIALIYLNPSLFNPPTTIDDSFQCNGIEIVDETTYEDIENLVMKATIYGTDQPNYPQGFKFLKELNRDFETIVDMEDAIQDYINDNHFDYDYIFVDIQFGNMNYSDRWFEVKDDSVTIMECYQLP